MDQLLAKVKHQISSIDADINKADLTTRDLNRLGKRCIGPTKSIEAFVGGGFRRSRFRLQRPDNECALILRLDGDTAVYSEICRVLRNYLFNNKLVLDDGSIRCDTLISRLTSNNTGNTNFFEILRNFRSLIV